MDALREARDIVGQYNAVVEAEALARFAAIARLPLWQIDVIEHQLYGYCHFCRPDKFPDF